MQDHDPKTGFLREFIAPYFETDIPKDDEPEIKRLLTEDLFAPLHRTLEKHSRIKIKKNCIEAQDYVLVNLSIDTFSRKEDQTRLIHKAGMQCRTRLGVTISKKAHFIRDFELNMKSELGDGPRKEFEAQGSTFKRVFNEMAAKPGVIGIPGLNFHLINRKSFFVQSIAMTARAHGVMAHYVASHDCYVEYMICYDHVVFTNHDSSVYVGEDCEAEFEATKICAQRPLDLSDEEKREIIATSRAEMEKIIDSVSPLLIPSHKSKMGRSIEKAAQHLHMDEERAVRTALNKMVHPDHFLGDRRHKILRNHDFQTPAAQMARTYLIEGQHIVTDLLNHHQFP